MSMHRAFVGPQILQNAKEKELLELPFEVAHRLLDVVRVKQGEHVELFDGQGLLVRGTVETRSSFHVQSVEKSHKTGPKLILAQAMVNQSKLEAIIQDATELGVESIILFSAAHSVAKVTDRIANQIERLQRIATDATRQCERSDIPGIFGPLNFAELIARISKSNSFAGDARAALKLTDALKAADASLDSILIIGPEGGLSRSELDQLKSAGAQIVRYAPHVLRTETAGLVGLSIIQSQRL